MSGLEYAKELLLLLPVILSPDIELVVLSAGEITTTSVRVRAHMVAVDAQPHDG